MLMSTKCPRKLHVRIQLLELSSFVHDIASLHQVDQVWIEDTLIGNNRKYSIQLTEVRGAVMAALALHVDVRLVERHHLEGTGGRGRTRLERRREALHRCDSSCVCSPLWE